MTQQEYANDLLRQGVSEDDFVLKMQEYKPEDNFVVEEEEVVDGDEKTKKEKRKEKRKNKKLEVEEIIQPTPTGFDAYEIETVEDATGKTMLNILDVTPSAAAIVSEAQGDLEDIIDIFIKDILEKKNLPKRKRQIEDRTNISWRSSL